MSHPSSISQAGKRDKFLECGPQWIHCGWAHIGEAVCFTGSTYQMLTSLANTPRKNKYSGYVWPARMMQKLTITDLRLYTVVYAEPCLSCTAAWVSWSSHRLCVLLFIKKA